VLAHWNNSLQVDISLCQTQHPDSNPTSFCSNSLRQSALVQKKQNSIFIVLSLTRLQIKSKNFLTWKWACQPLCYQGSHASSKFLPCRIVFQLDFEIFKAIASYVKISSRHSIIIKLIFIKYFRTIWEIGWQLEIGTLLNHCNVLSAIQYPVMLFNNCTIMFLFSAISRSIIFMLQVLFIYTCICCLQQHFIQANL
jgi:hypothetical protein